MSQTDEVKSVPKLGLKGHSIGTPREMPGPAEHQPRNPQVERLVLRQPEQRIPRSPHWRNSAPGDTGPLSRLAETAPRRVPPRPGRGVPPFSERFSRTPFVARARWGRSARLGLETSSRARTPPPPLGPLGRPGVGNVLAGAHPPADPRLQAPSNPGPSGPDT